MRIWRGKTWRMPSKIGCLQCSIASWCPTGHDLLSLFARHAMVVGKMQGISFSTASARAQILNCCSRWLVGSDCSWLLAYSGQRVSFTSQKDNLCHFRHPMYFSISWAIKTKTLPIKLFIVQSIFWGSLHWGRHDGWWPHRQGSDFPNWRGSEASWLRSRGALDHRNWRWMNQTLSFQGKILESQDSELGFGNKPFRQLCRVCATSSWTWPWMVW